MTDRQINALELQAGEHGFPKEKTFNNYRSILNTVNKHFGWEPDVIYYDRMDNKAREIADFIYEKYKIANTAQYKQKMSALSSLMSRTMFGKDHSLKLMVKNADKMLSVADKTVESPILDWEELQPKLVELGKQQSICGIIARIFSYGYVLRVGEIFETRIDEDNDYDNYLDLENCKWYIRKQKNGTEKIFDVDPELCLSIKNRPRCFDDRTMDAQWLLCKTGGAKYSTGAQRLPYHKWPLPSNTDIRKSYETWNRNKSGRTEEEMTKWHVILGHSKDTVKVHYDQKALAPAKPKPIVKIKEKTKKTVVVKKRQKSSQD